jgi:hypothetical protein
MAVIMATGAVTSGAMYLYRLYDGGKMYKQVKGHTMVFLYEPHVKGIGFAMYIKEAKDSNALIDYCKRVERNENNILMRFPVRYMPLGRAVYLVDNNALTGPSGVIEIVDINTVEATHDYRRGYICRGSVHLSPPPDSLVLEVLNPDNN